jgi:hypothetical protein
VKVARRLTQPALVTLCALVCALTLPGGAAQATVTHTYLSQITAIPAEGPKGEAIPSPGPLGEVTGMTVDGGEVYLAEGFSSPRLDAFEASAGAFVRQFSQVTPPVYDLRQGVAVGHAAGETEVYVAGDEEGSSIKGLVAAFSGIGGLQSYWQGHDTPSGGFDCFECEGTGDVAVDNSALGWAAGDVYVTDPEHAVVDVFKPQAGGKEEYVTQLTGTEPPSVPFGRPVHVAVSAFNGDVLVVDAGSSYSVDIFRPAAIPGQYEFVRKLSETPSGAFHMITDVAVDGASGDIYAADEANPGLVDQFDAAGEYLGHLTGTSTEPFGNVTSVAVDAATHDLYVGNFSSKTHLGAVDVFGPDAVIPDVATEAATNVAMASATLNGSVNPNGAGEATCQFAWGEAETLGSAQPCSAPVPDGEKPVAVHADLEGLRPDTTYYYRLQATNKNGANPGEPAQDGHFTTAGPGLHSESVVNVAATSATLEATIDPNGAPTSYYFQYSTQSTASCQASVSPGAVTPPCQDAPAPLGATVGSGHGDVSVAQHVQDGLVADSTYHYRVVVVSDVEVAAGRTVVVAVAGPDQTFVTQSAGALALSDGRAWEMVSPPEKRGAVIELSGIQAAASGGGITYLTNVPTELEPQGYTNTVQVLSTRSSGGWHSLDLALPHLVATGQSVGQGTEYRMFSRDLSLGLVQPFGSFNPSLSPEASEQTPYLRTDLVGGDVTEPCLPASMHCYRPLVTGASGYANVPPGTVFGAASDGRQCPPDLACGPEVQGATPDLSHVVLGTGGQALALTAMAAPEGGLYEWSAGRLTEVSVLPAAEGGSLVAGELAGGTRGRNAISSDGSRVVWSAEGHLYLRDTSKGETVRLDEGLAGTPSYQIASVGVTRVFFTDEGDLYVYDVERGMLTRMTTGAEIVATVLGASEDGAYVYFAANGRLAEGAVEGNCSTETRANAVCNLYVLHGGATTLVAVLSGGDNPAWQPNISKLVGRVSPDGRWLAFMSLRPLIGYDNRDAVSGQRDEELYLYDASSGHLTCASCDPTGARPRGFAAVGAELHSPLAPEELWGGTIAASVPGWEEWQHYQRRYLSDSGRLFFNSPDALVPQDVNGTWDVYKYEPDGVGGCAPSTATFSERSGGCVDLISSGTAVEESVFIDASESGDDAFFLTAARLSTQDFDTSFDIYDAHACSALAPCVSFAAQPPPCSTEASCRAAPSPQPENFAAPASATFSGAGNVVASTTKPAAPRKANAKRRRSRHKNKHKARRRANSHKSRTSKKGKG